jgi:2-polyprenyl-3-methyl-5-hydroxy-6-metoxy-1,4-benzoquinol methylase
MHGKTAGAVAGIANPAPEILDRILHDNWWYHQMQLTHGRVTPGQYGDNLIPVASLLPHVRLAGMKCLDIGAMDGKMSFLMEQHGASVLAVDGVARGTLPGLRDAYGSSVRYRSGIVLENLPELLPSEGLFDFVLCSGVAYHVYSPFDLIARVRDLLFNGGIALFESAAIPDDSTLTMTLNRGDYYNEYTTLWLPTTACFRYMLQFLSLRVIGEREWRTRGRRVIRHAWLVQADRPSVLAPETSDPWLATLLGGLAPGGSHEHLKPQFDHARFESRADSRITFTPVPERAPIRFDEPETYAAERALLATATPAWRHLDSGAAPLQDRRQSHDIPG